MIPPSEPLHPVRCEVLRDLSYRDGEARQRELVKAIAEDPARPGAIIFAEHRPVITCGRSGDGGNLLVSPDELAARGIEFHHTGRGGDVTYHGPGQWTVYPLLRLDWYNRDLHRYLRLLEDGVIDFLSAYGLAGTRRKGLTGVWIGNAKIAAVGIAVTRWITWHGLALNIHPDLSRFTTLMHPCGITAEAGGVASLELTTGQRHTLDGVLPTLRASLCKVLRLSCE